MKNTMVSMKEKLGFMTFSTSSNIVFNFKNIYYLIFLTNVLKIPVLTAGTILTLGTVWDAVNDPLIGYFQQTTHSATVRKSAHMRFGAQCHGLWP